MTNCLNFSKLAKDIFFKNHNSNYKSPIPNINNSVIYKDIKNAYYGGISEVYKPQGKNLYYYDEYFEYFDKTIPMSYKLFGYFYCKIKATKAYIGLLPYRTDLGLLHPLGEWEGWYFYE